jgi:ABC-2 type transport system ATP-binding protein
MCGSAALRTVARVDAMIVARGLTKRYGAATVVDGLTFEVPAGQVTGFVGPNGAGKSTTMRMVLGLATPDGGSVRVAGRRYRDLAAPLRVVGAVLDAGATHPDRRAYHHLLWLAQTNDLPRRRVDEVLELVGLGSIAGRRTGGFSLGMAQRLGIAGALLGDPPILMLDEPVNGLDPDGIRWIRGFLRALAAEGRAVFVSSHLMNELQDTADRLIVIGRGRLIADARVPDLLAAASDDRVLVRTPARAEAITVLSRAGATVASTDGDTLIVTGLPPDRVAALVVGEGLPLLTLAPHRASLEDAYVQLTRGAVDYTTELAGEVA